MSSNALAGVALISIGAYYLFYLSRQPIAPYPPGPPPKPIIGNLLDIPKERSWVHYLNMSKQYNSDIIHFSVGNMHIIVLNSLEIAQELFERRASIYSSRPLSPLMEMLGIEKTSPFLPYGDVWQKARKYLKEGLRKDLMPQYYDVLVEKVHLQLEMLLNEPENFMRHTKMLGASVVMSTLFGYDVDPRQAEDKYLTAAEFGNEIISEILTPGSTIIAVVPFLRHIPSWFPGASTQRISAKAKEATELYANGLFAYAKRNLAAGTSKNCVAAQLLTKHAEINGTEEDEEEIKDVLAGLYLAGVETMQSTQNVFFMVMALQPDEQKKAQEELDRVIGVGRLPTYKDRSSMPYVDALYREVLRWRPVGPLGLPRATTEDDVYKGQFIPKGAIVIASVWAFSRDENVYPDPAVFRPERFLNSDGTLIDDTIRYAFGFGRRICAGEYMADALVWMMMASVLAMFDIRNAKDEYGREVPIDVANGFVDQIASHPRPFKCSITARSHGNEGLIHTVAGAARENLRLPVNA